MLMFQSIFYWTVYSTSQTWQIDQLELSFWLRAQRCLWSWTSRKSPLRLLLFDLLVKETFPQKTENMKITWKMSADVAAKNEKMTGRLCVAFAFFRAWKIRTLHFVSPDYMRTFLYQSNSNRLHKTLQWFPTQTGTEKSLSVSYRNLVGHHFHFICYN